MEVCRLIKSVDIAPVLRDLDRLQFVHVNQGGGKYPCDVVLSSSFTAGIHQFVESLELGGRTARAMLRRLEPRQSIPPHVDDWMPKEMNWSRFQVPITSHPDIVMRWPEDGVSVHLEPGFLYQVRFDRTHQVDHNADCSRVHLQINQIDSTIGV